MTEERRLEINKEIKTLVSEFHENAHHGDGNFGALYLSCNVAVSDVQAELECERGAFKRMMLTLMEMNAAVAEDILEAAKSYLLKSVNK